MKPPDPPSRGQERASDEQAVAPPRRPLLVYDGDCGFCSEHATRYAARARGLVEVLAAAQLGEQHPEISSEQLARSVIYVDEFGELHEGADAVARALHFTGLRWPRWMYRFIPGLAPLAEWSYRRVANNRQHLGSKSCKLPSPPDPKP